MEAGAGINVSLSFSCLLAARSLAPTWNLEQGSPEDVRVTSKGISLTTSWHFFSFLSFFFSLSYFKGAGQQVGVVRRLNVVSTTAVFIIIFVCVSVCIWPLLPSA